MRAISLPTTSARLDAISSRLRQRLTARTREVPSWIVLVEVFLALGWLRAAVEKLIDPDWWRGTVLTDFVADHADTALPWFRPALDVVGANWLIVAIAVVGLQLFAAAALLTGTDRVAGLGVGAGLNLVFVAAGEVNPSIFYLVLQATVALWVLETRARARAALPVLGWATLGGAVLVTIGLPFVRTVSPDAVIDDPAAIFVFFGLLVVAATDLARRRIRGVDTRAERDDAAAGATASVG